MNSMVSRRGPFGFGDLPFELLDPVVPVAVVFFVFGGERAVHIHKQWCAILGLNQ